MFKDSLLNCCISKIVDSVCFLSEMLYKKQKIYDKPDIEYINDLYRDYRDYKDCNERSTDESRG